MPDRDEQTYRNAAKRLYHRAGEVEVDEEARVSVSEASRGSEGGAYVQAWVWVPESAVTEEDEETSPGL